MAVCHHALTSINIFISYVYHVIKVNINLFLQTAGCKKKKKNLFALGGKTVIQRGCADPLDDIHKLTSETPQHTRCEVKRNPSNNRLEARCYYACKRNNCNNVTLGKKVVKVLDGS